MKSSCFLGKMLLALGICLVLLSMGVAVDQAYAGCDWVCSNTACSLQTPGIDGSGCDGLPCPNLFCTADCICKKPSFGDQNICTRF